MPTGQRQRLLNHFRRAVLRHDGGGLSDGQLLACFVERRDEDAFAALMRRHGTMVLGVCRRVLRNAADAEDAFQATFLVLARKAGSLRSRELVGNWLYGTAYRTALEARAAIARRLARERAAAVPEARYEPEAGWRELLPLLDRELSRLPAKYREAVVLCELQGKTRKEAARLLGLPEGTVSSRLAAARRLLARRLARYGVAVVGLSLAGLLAEGGASAGVPAALLAATARGAALVAGGSAGAGVISTNVLMLMKGALKAMFLAKLKTAAAVVFGVAVLGVGTGGLVYGVRAGAAENHRGQATAAAVPAKPGGAGAVRADPAQDEDLQKVQERERAARQARDAEEGEARAERDKAARALDEARLAIAQAKMEADRARREAEAARAEAQRERARAEQALQEVLKLKTALADKAAAGGGQSAPEDPKQAKALHDELRSKLDAQAAILKEQLGQLAAQQRELERGIQAKRDALTKQLKQLAEEMDKANHPLKEKREDRRRQVAPSGDKLDLILQRLDQMERRLDRIERGSQGRRRPPQPEDEDAPRLERK